MPGQLTEPRAWWFGCWLEPGHHLWDRAGRSGRDMEPCPLGRSLFEVGWLDGSLAPRRARVGARLPIAVPSDRVVFTQMGGDDKDLRRRIERESDEADQGEVLLHIINGCTIAAWWDRTQGDTRGACNSCLIVEGVRSASEMLELFPRLFPAQAGRLAAAGVSLRYLRWG